MHQFLYRFKRYLFLFCYLKHNSGFFCTVGKNVSCKIVGYST